MNMSVDENPSGPLELLASARDKYTLAMARVRHSPPELALLSLHGSLEDALRSYALRLPLPEARAPFGQLLEAMKALPQAALSPAEAEGIRRMHRLRARVAQGESLALTAETIATYHRLVARLLQRYGIVVVAPGDEVSTTQALALEALAAEEPRATIPLHAAPGAKEARSPQPRPSSSDASGRSPQQTAGEPPRRPLRPGQPSSATSELPIARELRAQRGPSYANLERAEQLADFWARWQGWMLPIIIILSIFLVGFVISISLQQIRTSQPVVPTAANVLVATATLESTTTNATEAEPAGDPPAEPPSTSVDGLALGRTVYVRADAGALNLRLRPGTSGDNEVQTILMPGTAAEIIAGPVELDGYTWWQVRVAGNEGWCAGQFLEVR
ncbi:SH3 domain-containing protein [Candidatus Chloroploca sp. Khr17]|uniref:SH3 domain-containing protein n=1 Tax=Candidatus Chloroploca sp. Khr17 TaxID=2496869 RepID=UPI00101DA78E|nr:SH3 domain-containing protein [Candidatus Chloroploca sp. Khr17]